MQVKLDVSFIDNQAVFEEAIIGAATDHAKRIARKEMKGAINAELTRLLTTMQPKYGYTLPGWARDQMIRQITEDVATTLKNDILNGVKDEILARLQVELSHYVISIENDPKKYFEKLVTNLLKERLFDNGK